MLAVLEYAKYRSILEQCNWFKFSKCDRCSDKKAEMICQFEFKHKKTLQYELQEEKHFPTIK